MRTSTSRDGVAIHDRDQGAGRPIILVRVCGGASWPARRRIQVNAGQ
ncbi:hypothetical protein [Burkholderia sp. PU8-34]